VKYDYNLKYLFKKLFILIISVELIVSSSQFNASLLLVLALILVICIIIIIFS